MNERSIFMAALERASPPERSAYLDEACGADTALRQRVEALLASHEQAGSFLGKAVPERLADKLAAVGETRGEPPPAEAVPGGDTRAVGPPAESLGSRIGPYKLLQDIGEGGMGTVFLAEQARPVQRMVALKIIKAGMDSRQVIARFEAERQALALMDHPNIAKVLDAGTTESGRPFFVMELVKGVPITKYCDEHRLTPKQRLELFVPVCQAVQHAHQKGIIHRDLKPSNVMVCLYDGRPVPKVIDFGVAKATGQKLTERTMFTEVGQVVGTLEYMSPEQAELNQLDIDTRSDIYSLGVLLYELLTGSTPLDRKRLKSAAVLEVLRVIREEEPPRPSTRLSESKDSLPSISAQRQTEPATLTKLMRGELDWIVMKALEKDRNRRYETANGLALDLQRHLADEPVLACPPSVSYRLRKFARRNKGKLALAAGLFLALTVMAASIGWAVRDRIEREAESQREQDARRAKTAEKVRASWNAARTLLAENKLTAARQKLAEAQAQLANDPSALPDLAAQVEAGAAELQRLHRFMDLIDRAQEAETRPVLEAASSADTHGGPGGRARASIRGRRPAQAVPFLLQALDCFGVLERDNWSTTLPGGWLNNDQVQQIRRAAYEQLLWLADDVLKRGQEHRSKEKLSPQAAARAALSYLKRAEMAHAPTRAFYLLRADSYKALGQGAEHEADRRHAENTPPTLALDDYLPGIAADDMGKFEDANKAFEAGLLREPTHYWSLLRLGYSILRLSYERNELDYASQAARIFSGCILKRPEHGHAYACRGQAFLKLRQYDRAIADCSRALDLDPGDAIAWSERSRSWAALGEHEKSLADSSKAVELDPTNAVFWTNRGVDYGMLGRADKALADHSKAIELDSKRSVFWSNRGDAQRATGHFDQAVADHTKALEIDPNNVDAWTGRGIVFLDHLDRPEEALADLSKAVALDPTSERAWLHRGRAHRQLGHVEKAVADFSKAITLAPKSAQVWHNRGLAYAKLRQYDKAIADYDKAIEINAKYAGAWISRGVLYCDYLGQPNKAVADFSRALKLDPKDKRVWFNRGLAHEHLRQYAEAIADCSAAIKLDPTFDDPWFCRHRAYVRLDRLDQAIAAYSSGIGLAPKSAVARHFRGIAYLKLGRLDEAITDFNQAITLKPEFAEAHCDLGHALRQHGELRQALEEMRRGHELGSKNPHWRHPSALWVKQCERLVALEAKLPDILEGKTPASPDERIELAQLCSAKRLHHAAAQFYREAFSERPVLADDPGVGHRYNAACAAALAGCGQGKDADKLDANDRARLRRQALDWLRADLDAWSAWLNKESDEVRPIVMQQMRHWLADTDFAGVREPQALAKLPEAERQPWQKLWDDVANTLGRAKAKNPDGNAATGGVGGIYDNSDGFGGIGTLTIDRSIVSGNSVNAGGGIYNDVGGVLTIEQSLVAGNTAPAGAGADLYNAGSATLIDSLVLTIDGTGSLVVRHH